MPVRSLAVSVTGMVALMSLASSIARLISVECFILKLVLSFILGNYLVWSSPLEAKASCNLLTALSASTS